LAIFLHKIINNNIKNPDSHIKNSFILVNKLKNLELPIDSKLASFDVVSLFTNISTDLVNNSISKRWDEIQPHIKIPLNEFLYAVNMVLDSSYFKFNNKIYKQIFGTPMGSSLSPIIAEIIMRDLETLALNSLSYHIPLYYRYVDDILIAIPNNHIEETLTVFNSLHERIKFTAEINTNNQISFLNLQIFLDNNKLTTDLYSKPTFSGRYLNFFSNHPLS